MANVDTSSGLNPFDLPTQQRRLRHFKSLAVRNLVCKGYMGRDVVKLQTFFTLHRDVESRAFYTSEKIIGSLNPSWQSFDLSRLDEEVDMAAKFVVVRVWGGHDKKFRLLMEWQVHFSGLVFLADKLQKDGMKFAANSLVFGLFEKYFSMPITVNKPDSSSEPGVISKQPSITVDLMTVHNSYGVSSLARIHTVLRAIRQTQVTVRRVHRSIEDKLLASQETSTKLSEREALLLKVHQLRAELRWQTSQLQCDKDKHDRQKNLLKQRGTELKENFGVMSNKTDDMLQRKQQHIMARESLVKTNAQLNMRRKQLIEELATYIYPITEMPENRGHRICGVKLPNAEEFQGHDDSSIAVALGYTCHMIVMMSEFLDTPLWYPLEHRGSKSVVRDHIISKLPDKDREFVLYGKSKDKIQFHYGVYLVNKNISQLRYQFGLGTQDLRMTLHNLKTLLELRLGVKYDSTQKVTTAPINAADRQLSLDTNNSHLKEGLVADNLGNDLSDRHGNEINDRRGNEDQMLEVLIQESRAMTGDGNQAWVNTLNSKQTWSPSLQKKLTHGAENQEKLLGEKNPDIFKGSNDEFFNTQISVPVEVETCAIQSGSQEDISIERSSQKSTDDGLEANAQNSQTTKKLQRQNVQHSFDTEISEVLRKTWGAQSLSFPETENESDQTESESQTRGSIYPSTSGGGTFKTSAFTKVWSIDSSEEATEQTNLITPEECTQNTFVDHSDLAKRTELLCEQNTSFSQIVDTSKVSESE